MADPKPETAAQMLSAVARSFEFVKMTRISDSVVGMIIAPPTPRNARTAITTPGESAKKTRREATPKMV